MRDGKIGNEYQRSLGKFYALTPKAVFAALAWSFANRLFATVLGSDVEKVLVAEWRILHENGIVRQYPPKGNGHD